MKIKIWISALAIISISSFAMAQETPASKEEGKKNTKTERFAFTDNNMDGICDNAGTNQGKGNSKGTCKGQGGQGGQKGQQGKGSSKRNGSCQNS